MAADKQAGSRITDISLQAGNKNRVNVSVDGVYRFSLDVFQVGELGLKVGRAYTDEALAGFEQESQFGKLYTRAVEYCLGRPHSAQEIRRYLHKKTLQQRRLQRQTGLVTYQPGVPASIAERVYERLQAKGHIDDVAFARWWVETRKQRTGTSRRRLAQELAAKGVSREIAQAALDETNRHDMAELAKMVAKKSVRYPDRRKLIAYLQRQGFDYSDIVAYLDKHDLQDEPGNID